MTITSTDYRTAPVTLSPFQTYPTQSQTISSTNGGLGDSSGISSSVVTANFSDLLMNGGIAGGVGVILTVAILYTIVICRRKRAFKLISSTAKTTIPLIPQKNSSTSSSSSSFSVMNPLKEQGRQQRQQLPLNRLREKSSKKSVSGKR